jgi:hypothetical protein
MKRCRLLAPLVVALVTPLTLADSLGPINLFNGVNFTGTFKTPPLSSTDTLAVPLGYHATSVLPGWSGAVFNVMWDTTEVSFAGIAPSGIVSQATNLTTFTTTGGMGFGIFNFWTPNAFQSGTTVLPSVANPFGSLLFHVTGTTPANNSDTDIFFGSFVFAQHTPEGQGIGPYLFNAFHLTATTTVVAQTSDWIYINTSGDFFQPPPMPGEGAWAHFAATFTFTLFRSNFVGSTAFLTAGGGIGVEHVPEPTTGVALLLGGVAALFVARRRSTG